jgi:hypothetical protein
LDPGNATRLELFDGIAAQRDVCFRGTLEAVDYTCLKANGHIGGYAICDFRVLEQFWGAMAADIRVLHYGYDVDSCVTYDDSFAMTNPGPLLINSDYLVSCFGRNGNFFSEPYGIFPANDLQSYETAVRSLGGWEARRLDAQYRAADIIVAGIITEVNQHGLSVETRRVVRGPIKDSFWIGRICSDTGERFIGMGPLSIGDYVLVFAASGPDGYCLPSSRLSMLRFKGSEWMDSSGTIRNWAKEVQR